MGTRRKSDALVYVDPRVFERRKLEMAEIDPQLSWALLIHDLRMPGWNNQYEAVVSNLLASGGQHATDVLAAILTEKQHAIYEHYVLMRWTSREVADQVLDTNEDMDAVRAMMIRNRERIREWVYASLPHVVYGFTKAEEIKEAAAKKDTQAVAWAMLELAAYQAAAGMADPNLRNTMPASRIPDLLDKVGVKDVPNRNEPMENGNPVVATEEERKLGDIPRKTGETLDLSMPAKKSL